MVGRIVELAVRPSERLTPGPGMQDQIAPRILGRIADEGCKKDVAVLVLHPAVNFMHHYLIEPLQQRGIAAMGLNTRFVGNDSQLLTEQAIQDLGAGVKYLREQGHKRVVLFGNSGGGSVASLYQAQAEHLTIATTPDGVPFDLRREDVPPVDAIVLASAHTSRAHQLRDCLDASVIDEADPWGADPELDMFNPVNGPPYQPEFLKRYRAAQLQRYERINEWVLRRLRQLAAMGQAGRAVDCAFVIHRTYARPETLDNAIDPNDRPATGTIWAGRSRPTIRPTCSAATRRCARSSANGANSRAPTDRRGWRRRRCR